MKLSFFSVGNPMKHRSVCISLSTLLLSIVIPQAWSEQSAEIFSQNTRGIIISPSSSPQINQPVEGIEIRELTLPGPKEVLEKRLCPFLSGKDLTSCDVEAIRNEVARFYADYHHPFVRISVPKQSRSNSILSLVVQEALIGKIEVKGNEHFSSQSIEKLLRVRSKDTINTKQMLSDINFINRNPFRRVDVIYSAGDLPGTTDILLSTQDRITFRAYAGYDNTGVEPLGEGRLFGGFNWANVFNLDHIFSFQYTTNPSHPSQFQSCTAHYTAPLSWRHVLVTYGGYSWIQSPTTPGARSNGQTAQASFRYQIPLPPFNGFLHECEWGADWKWTNNEIIFNSNSGIERYANLFQFEAGYNLDYQTQNTNTTFEITALAGPGKWLPHQSDSDYFLLRNGAKPAYFYFRSTLSEVVQMPKGFSIWSFLRGQMSTSNLLPSEQVGLGGYDTIRGYYERTFNVDNAFIANLEIRAPTIKFSKQTPRNQIRNELTFLGFFDYGYGANHQGNVAGESETKPTVWLASAGPGVRWYFGEYISARLDWGIRIHQNAQLIGSGWQQPHFSFIASY